MSDSTSRSRAYEHGQQCGRGAAFTLVELLVVIVVIGIVMSLLLLVGGRVLEHQKRAATQNTMRLTEMAIEQFKTTDPLRDIYNNPKLRDRSGGTNRIVGCTFGPYPPYQLAGGEGSVTDDPGNVRSRVEPQEALRPHLAGNNYTLHRRLVLDLGLDPSEDDNDAHISIRRSSERPTTDEDYLAYYSYDNRALYCYLAAFTPGVLDQIPDSAKKPLRRAASASAGSTDTTEMIDPDGGLLDRPGPRAFDVLGIYDAWGVPLDYFVQAKLERKIGPNGTEQWVVTDRVPVLRSRGVPREKAIAADRAAYGGDDALWEDEEGNWIFSQPFPRPAFRSDSDQIVAKTGEIKSKDAKDGGWVRVRAGTDPNIDTRCDSYKYVP